MSITKLLSEDRSGYHISLDDPTNAMILGSCADPNDLELSIIKREQIGQIQFQNMVIARAYLANDTRSGFCAEVASLLNYSSHEASMAYREIVRRSRSEPQAVAELARTPLGIFLAKA